MAQWGTEMSRAVTCFRNRTRLERREGRTDISPVFGFNKGELEEKQVQVGEKGSLGNEAGGWGQFHFSAPLTSPPLPPPTQLSAGSWI